MAKFNKDCLVARDLVAREKQKLSDPLNSLYGEIENKNDGERITELPISSLTASTGNHWSMMCDQNKEKWDEFLGSIKNNGVYSPIIVRPLDNGMYEIIAGHNRATACNELGLETIPAIIKQLTDDDLEEIVSIRNDTNLQREEVSDLEKGWAYRELYEAIARKGQGKRNDLLNGLEVQNVNDGLNGLEVQNVNISKTSTSYEVIAEKYGINEKTVRRKIRLTYLIEEVYKLYEKKKITQGVAEQFSYLKPSEQAQCEYCINEKGITFTDEDAKKIRIASKENTGEPLSDVDILNIVNAELPAEKEKPKKVKKYALDDTLFPLEIAKANDRQKYIETALKYILENNIKF